MAPAHERAVLANAVRHNHPPEAVDAARRDLAMANAEEAIRRIVDAAPPLTDSQRSQLAIILLRPGGGDG